MVFDVTKTSDSEYKSKINLKTIADLLMFMEFNRNDVIIYRPTEEEPNYEIQIFDYVE